MTIPPGRYGTPTDDFAARRRRAAANLRIAGAAAAAVAYLVLLLLALMVATAEPRFAAPLLITAGTGTITSIGLFVANLLTRAAGQPSPVPRAFTILCLVMAALATVSLLGLGLYHIATADMTTALLAFGCVVPLLGVAVPGLPTLVALGRGASS